ncbi:hypothetical protein BJX99DRAFT_174699 [Aspergillus californicus]
MNPVFIALATVTGLVRATASLASVDQSAWETFNKSINGRLHKGEPMLAPCYLIYDGQTQIPDDQECTVIQESRMNATFISDLFGGYETVNWGACQATGESCAFGSSIPDLVTPVTRACYQGSVPSKYVDARSVENIQRTLAFARVNDLRLVVKNTGHDYTGRSSGAGALALWTHNIQPPMTLKRDFIPDGCVNAVGDVITFGAGQQFSGIYEFAHEHDYIVVGGASETVGAAGGWITGGGHSLISNELGLGVDNVQQLKAVLPNGTYVTANRCVNQDIFFALRGGGGGTFGVITEMSTLAHPERPMVAATVTFSGITAADASKLISISVANADKWASEGWGGYIILGLQANGSSTFFMATSMLNQTAAEISMDPIMDFANCLGTPVVTSVSSTNTYFQILSGLLTGDDINSLIGVGMAVSSRIIPREHFRDPVGQKKVSSIVYDMLAASQDTNPTIATAPLWICAVAPTIYSRNLPESDQPDGPGASSVTPAWRTGLWHTIMLQPFVGSMASDAEAVRDTFQAAHDIMKPLREYTPNGGAYLNEADAFETDPVGSFWGENNYARLLSIKEEIDPTNLLSVWNGIGWNREDERFSCYPDIDA